MSYDPFKDFAPITITAKNTSLLTVRADDGPKTIKELIERGKASSRKLTYGAGITITRLAGLEFAKAAGIEVVLVPYKGSAEVVQGLLTGSVDFIVDGMAASLPLIQSGKLRALAKLNNRHLTALPDVQPLSVAAGLPQIPEMSSWIGLVAPAGTPPADRRQDPARGHTHLCRPGGREPARAVGHQSRHHHARRVRQVLPRRGGALDQGVQGQRRQVRLPREASP